ncbi:hypothetical protein L1049_025598 [Liquidambar formosana]|uniref:Uncharacterized protein n=1 Tax=Liquidambar formosana TaxID=63359 RepID=A0AAP0NBK8_LIQFO
MSLHGMQRGQVTRWHVNELPLSDVADTWPFIVIVSCFGSDLKAVRGGGIYTVDCGMTKSDLRASNKFKKICWGWAFGGRSLWFFDDCNSVDHSPVPRKLRSAMKKRSRESISPPLPDSKKLNHTIDGVESTRKDGVKKSKANRKQGSSDWSLRRANSGPITKEEEEAGRDIVCFGGNVTQR